MNYDLITKVYRERLLKRDGSGNGYRFFDQAGAVLRGKATRPYKLMSIQLTPLGNKYVSFHTDTVQKQHKTYTIERVIQIEEWEAKEPK